MAWRQLDNAKQGTDFGLQATPNDAPYSKETVHVIQRKRVWGKGTGRHSCSFFVSLPGRFQVGLVVPDLETLLSWEIQDIYPYRVGWSVNLAWDTGKGLHTCFTMPRFFYSVVWKKHWSLPITNTGSGWSGPAVPTIGCWSGPIPDRPILRSISFRLPAHSW